MHFQFKHDIIIGICYIFCALVNIPSCFYHVRILKMHMECFYNYVLASMNVRSSVKQGLCFSQIYKLKKLVHTNQVSE